MSAEPSRLFRSRGTADALGIYLPAAVAYRSLGLVRGVILAWLIVPAEYGLLQMALVTVNVLMPLAGLGLNEAVARYVPQYEARGELRAFLRRAWLFAMATTAVLCGLTFAAAGPLTRLILGSAEAATADGSQRVELTRWAVACVLVLIAYMFLLAAIKGLRMFLAVSLLELAGGVGFTALAVVLAACGWRSADAVLVAFVAVYMLVTAAVGLLLIRHLGRSIGQDGPLEGASRSDVPRQMVQFGMWLALAAVLWQIMQHYPMWYLQRTQGPQATAVFAGVRLIAQAILIAAVSVVMVVQATVTRAWEAEGPAAADRKLGLAFKTTGIVMLAGCGALVFAAPIVMRLFPADYGSGVGLVPVLTAFCMVAGCLSFLVIHFTLIEKTRYLFGLWLVGVLANAMFAHRLVRPDMPATDAMQAAAWAGLLGITTALLACLAWMRLEHRPIDRGAVLLIASAAALVLPTWCLAAWLTILLLLVLCTGLVLDDAEKLQVRQSAVRWVGRHKLR